MPEELTPIEFKLLQITHNFLQELKAEQASRGLSLNASLEKDLGLGSLERVELSRRIERAFSMELPLALLEKVSVLNDFVSLIEQAHPSDYMATKKLSQPLSESKIDPHRAHTLIELLEQYAQLEPERPHIYLQDEDGHEQIVTYGELAEMAGASAQIIAEYKIKPGETIAIMLPTSREYFFYFFGILLAGAIPVPIYPPTQTERIEEYVRRQAKILRNAEIRLLVTVTKGRTLGHLLKSFIPSLYAVLTVEDLKNLQGKPDFFSAKSDDAALIQYTSGSTGDPKGVLLSHQNLLSNIRAVGQALQVRPTDCMVSWLPLYHDMGLIGAWLGSFYYGVPVCILSPLAFLMRPERWLWAIHYHRATISGAPNFAYELCVKSISSEKISGLDLSSWRLALNGSETIHAKTIRRFAKKFAPYYFNPKAMTPAYGLAESTMGLIFTPPGRGPKIDQINRDAFMQQGKAMPTKLTDKSTLEIVSCGVPFSAHAVRIVDDNNKLMNEREVGSLQFNGPSTMCGYYHNPDATRAVFHDGWLDSGDLAYQAEGEIYITGRKKDIIITAGRNIYPEEIEKIVGDIPGVVQGCVIAFGVPDPQSGTEQCIVVAETQEQDATVRQGIIHKINTEIALSLNITLHQVILANPQTVPKTSSGKLQRSTCKRAYLGNQLVRHKQPIWLQMTKLLYISLQEKIRLGLIKSGKFIYTFYIWLIIFLTVIPLWLIILPCDHKTSSRLVSGWARLILKLGFCSLKVEGELQSVKRRAMILVCNHASYVDAIALLAALPIDMAFLAKKELTRIPILSVLLNKLDYILVNRVDFLESIQDTALIQKILTQGRSVLIFPEGTFTYATGLRTFKMGAFKLAVDTQLPLCPISLRGTRQMFRDNQWLLTPGTLTVHIGSPIIPQQDGWEEMARLRDLTRQEIAKYCGEQPINLV